MLWQPGIFCAMSSDVTPLDHGTGVRRRSPVWLGLVLAVTAITLGLVYVTNRHLQGEPLTSDGHHGLRLMTWNIGKLYHLRWDSRAADADLNHVAQVIRRTNPHLVALQELTGPTQLGQLVSLLGHRWRGQVAEDEYDRRAGLLTRLPVHFVDLPTSSGRIAQGALVTHIAGGKLLVVSVHLDAFDADRRLLQAEEIMAGMQRLAVKDMVIMGDFNFDASMVTRDSTDDRIYRFLTQHLTDMARQAGVTTVISRRLDYVFCHSPRVVRSRSQVLLNRRINIMDHDPLLVELVLEGAR